jgi:hypothetical protein
VSGRGDSTAALPVASFFSRPAPLPQLLSLTPPTYTHAPGVAEADSIILLVDGQAGLQPGDAEILDWLRHNHPGKPVVLAVNKCESSTKADIQVGGAYLGWSLGREDFGRGYVVASAGRVGRG